MIEYIFIDLIYPFKLGNSARKAKELNMGTNEKVNQTEVGDLLSGVSNLRSIPEWLLAPLQNQLVVDALRKNIPEFNNASYSFIHCKVKRLVLKNMSGIWEGTYSLKVQFEPEGPERELLLRGRVTAPWLHPSSHSVIHPVPFGSPDWTGFLPELNLSLEMQEPEAELVALVELVDPVQSRILLGSMLRVNGNIPEGVSIASCTPKVLSYKPASRCTILYDLEYTISENEFPPLAKKIIGKIYRESGKAENAYDGMSALWHSPLSKNDVVTIAKPLGYLTERKAVFQELISGEQSLEDMLKTFLKKPDPERFEELLGYVRKTAVGLAAIHNSGVDFGMIAGLDRRFSQIRSFIERLAVPFPELQGVFEPLLTFLMNFDSDHPVSRFVPTHGTFNPEQVLIDHGRIGIIDFDDYSMAEPAMDVGLFRAAIKDTGMNALDLSQATDETVRLARLSLLDEINDVFLAEYEANASVEHERVALWESVDYLRNCLYTWIKVKPAEADHAFINLEHSLQRIVQ